jgi:hypothetical protein
VWGVATSSAFRLARSVTGLFPRSTYRICPRPPFDFWRSYLRSVKVLLWRLVLSLAINLHPPSVGVLVSGDRYFVYVRDGSNFF